MFAQAGEQTQDLLLVFCSFYSHFTIKLQLVVFVTYTTCHWDNNSAARDQCYKTFYVKYECL
jgi:hypothetical protein